MKTKHTPGPWNYGIRTGKEDTHCISGPQGKVKIAEMVQCNDTGIMAANARLIAAAPELLNAAIVASDILADINQEHTGLRNNPGWEPLDNLCAAIAKATGE